MSQQVYAVEAVDLYKSYGDTWALNGLTMRIGPGEIYGLLGPNGAGKTTTLKILAGLLKPSRGYARIYGVEVSSRRVEALRLVGYVPENPVVFQNLTVEEFLRFVVALRGLNWREVSGDAEYYLEVFGLAGRKDSFMGELSRGMVQKVLVSAAFLVRPKVLLMDEPTAGMDPESQHVFKEEVRRLSSKGVTSLISSHQLDSVERLCTRVGIIYKGRLIAEGTVEELKSRVSEKPGSTLEEAFLKIVKSGESGG